MALRKQGRVMGRGKRVIVHTCIGHVITRFMTEANLTYRELFEYTGISKSTLHGWTCGVILENPDVLIVLKDTFTRLLKREISTDDLLFGKDEDRLKMKERIAQLEQEARELSMQLALFEIAEKEA